MHGRIPAPVLPPDGCIRGGKSVSATRLFALPILSTDWIASGKVFGPPADWERVCWWGKAWHKLWSPVWLPLQLPTEKLGVGEVRRGGLRGQDGVHPGGNTVPVRCHPAHASFTEGCPQREEWSADSPTQLTGEAWAVGVPPGTNAMEVEWVGGWSGDPVYFK